MNVSKNIKKIQKKIQKTPPKTNAFESEDHLCDSQHPIFSIPLDLRLDSLLWKTHIPQMVVNPMVMNPMGSNPKNITLKCARV